MAKKIALVVEPSFLDRHWGVRVYVYSLAKVLGRQGWMVDFVSPQQSVNGEIRWYKLHLNDAALFAKAAPMAAGRPADVWSALREPAMHPEKAAAPTPVSMGFRHPAAMPIGTSLALENYDVALITNPWMVWWRERLAARTTMGLVLDLIPSLFGVMLDEGKPFGFAHQHEIGFRYYEEHCDRVLTISAHTRDMYLEFVRGRRPGKKGPDVVAVPPFAPYSSLAQPSDACPSTRAARVALAGCFDLRKGLRELPELLNGLAGDLEEVVIYGGLRCRPADAEAFFSKLRLDRVVWHLGATAEEVHDIYGKSRLLLFPSRYEGLGLPLIEAQLEGCRVATYPVSPMKELGLAGAVALAEKPADSIQRLREALGERFDHTALRAEARTVFVESVLASDPLEPTYRVGSGSRLSLVSSSAVA
jgi:glycosyltransferase involved in cell wall biosynthesis